MVGGDSGTAQMACIVRVTRDDLQALVRQGWVLVGDGEDHRGESRRERRERLRRRSEERPDLSELADLPQRERDPGVEAAEENRELSALLYLNGADRPEGIDTSLDVDAYVRLNVALESLYRLLDGEVFQWGERYGRPLYVDSEGVDRERLPTPR